MSQATRTKPCQSCAEEMAAWPVNRKYCGVCQIVRDDIRRKHKPLKSKKCKGIFGEGTRLTGETCGTFYPVRSNYDKCYCCTDWKGGERSHHPECSQCGKRYRTAFGLANTCMQCVQASAKNRDVYLRMLRKIYAERIADPERVARAEQAVRDDERDLAARKAKKAAATTTTEPEVYLT